MRNGHDRALSQRRNGKLKLFWGETVNSCPKIFYLFFKKTIDKSP